MITVGGREYGTAAQLAARLGPDITAAMLRNWARRDGLTAIRIAAGVVYPLDEAARIEAAKYTSGRGRPRRLDKIRAAAA